MLVKFCVNSDDVKKVNKTFTDVLEVDLKLRSDFDIINPTLILLGDFSNYNYVLIDDLNRGYFINSFEKVENNLYKLHCSCDYLYSFKDVILNGNARFKRNIKTGDFIGDALDKGVKTTITKFSGDVELTNGSSLILSSLGV